MTKLEEIKDILETAPLDKITTQTLYDIIMEVIERKAIRTEQVVFGKLSDAIGEEIKAKKEVAILRKENKKLKKKLKRSIILPKTKLSKAQKTLLKDLK